MAKDKQATRSTGRYRLVVLLVVLAICGGPMLVSLWRVWRQSRAIQHVETLRGRISYAYDVQEVLPEWTRRVIPRTVQGVDLRGTKAANRDICCLADLYGIKQLDLTATKVGSGGLSPLARVAELEKLRLDRTMVTDEDLSALAGLRSLKELSLSKTRITVAGIRNLGPQPALVRLDLSGTRVKDADLGALANLVHLQDLCLSESQITSVGVARLKSLSNLRNICVKIDAGTGKAARDMLNKCGVRAVGRGGVTETRLWDSQSPWSDSLAGTIETIERVSGWPSQRSDELVQVYCRALADHEFPRADSSSPAAPRAPGPVPATSPVRELTCAEFLELARQSPRQDRPSLESFAKSALSREAVAELIGSLDVFSSVPAEGPLEQSQANQLRWVTNAIVQQGLGYERTTAALDRLLKNGNPGVKATAIYSLNLVEHRRMLNDPVWKPDKTYPAAVVKLLAASVEDSGWEVQTAAASAMSWAAEIDSTQAKTVMPLLVSMLKAPDPHSTPEVLSAIRRTADADIAAARDAVPELVRMCEAAKVREKVIFAEALCHVACKHADDTRAAALPLMPLLSYADLPRRSTTCRFLRSAAERQPASLDVILPVVVRMFNESTVADGSPAGDALAAIADGVHARANR